MKKAWLTLLLLNFFISFFTFASSAANLESEVTVKQAHIWKTPGYTWRDCRPGEPQVYDKNYANDEDRKISYQRYKSGGQKACSERNDERDLLKESDTIEVITDSTGSPVTAVNPKDKTDEFEANFRGEVVKIRYYKVRNSKGVEGWMASTQIATPRPKASWLSKASDYIKSKCPPWLKREETAPTADPVLQEARPDQIEIPKVKSAANDILEATDQQMKIGPTKTEAEMDRYMCIYRHSKKDLPTFLKELETFKKAAKDAAEAFKMPYSMVMCTILIESRLHFDPKEIERYHEQSSRPLRKGEFYDKYLGFGQVGPELVADLQEAKESPPFKAMWEKYKKKNKDMNFTQQEVLFSKDPRGSMVAAAFAFRYIYEKRFPKKDCVGCSRDSKFNRKDMDMMVAGYNWGTGMLGRLKEKSSGQLRTRFPPPEETRNYMRSMESCMESGYERTFRDQPADMAKTNDARRKQIANAQQRIKKLSARQKGKTHQSNDQIQKLIQAEKKSIAELERKIAINVSPDHGRNVAQCDAHFPKTK